jgi:hypothetical protein
VCRVAQALEGAVFVMLGVCRDTSSLAVAAGKDLCWADTNVFVSQRLRHHERRRF